MAPLDDRNSKSPRKNQNDPNLPDDQRNVKRGDDGEEIDEQEEMEGPDEEESGDDEA